MSSRPRMPEERRDRQRADAAGRLEHDLPAFADWPCERRCSAHSSERQHHDAEDQRASLSHLLEQLDGAGGVRAERSASAFMPPAA